MPNMPSSTLLPRLQVNSGSSREVCIYFSGGGRCFSLLALCICLLGLLSQNSTDWVASEQQKFLTILETGSPRSWPQHGQVRDISGVHSQCFFAASSRGGRGKGSVWSFSGTNEISVPPHPHSGSGDLPKVFPPITIICGGERFNIFISGEHIQTMAPSVLHFSLCYPPLPEQGETLADLLLSALSMNGKGID